MDGFQFMIFYNNWKKLLLEKLYRSNTEVITFLSFFILDTNHPNYEVTVDNAYFKT